MDYQTLKNLIQTHPNWPAVDDEVLVTWVNEEVMSRDKDTAGSGELFACILQNLSEWTSLSASDQTIIKDILYIHSGEGIPTSPGSPARNILVQKLGTNTKQCISNKISEIVSRAAYTGIPGAVHLGDIQNARNLP